MRVLAETPESIQSSRYSRKVSERVLDGFDAPVTLTEAFETIDRTGSSRTLG